MILTGYIDESYNDKVFTLSCLMTTISDWMWFEAAWKKAINAVNKSLKAQGRMPISRYHAADCSSCKGEFEGWTKEEQIALTKRLIGVFEQNSTNVISYSVSVKDFMEVFPEAHSNWMEQCYGLLVKFMIDEMASQFTIAQAAKRYRKAIKIALLHDHGPYDGTLLAAFNSMMDDPGFKGREYFSTIAPITWTECIPLQAADLLAYENFKDSESFLFTKRKRRKTLELLLGASLGGRARTIDAIGLRKLREMLESRREESPAPTINLGKI